MVERLHRIVMFPIFEFRSAESEKRKEEGGKAIESSFAHLSFQFLTSEVERVESGVQNLACRKMGSVHKRYFWSQKGSVKGGTTVIVMYIGS